MNGRNHNCPDQVPIYVIQELLEMFELDNASHLDEGDSFADEIIMVMKDS